MSTLSFLRGLALALAGLAVLVLLSPWLLYEAALWSIEGRPAKPVQLASAEQQAAVWNLARGSGPLSVEPLDPYLFVWRLASTSFDKTESSETLAYWVSREHMWAQPQRRGIWYWHISNAALTIWLTRHWTAEELASFMVPVTARWPPPRKPGAQP